MANGRDISVDFDLVGFAFVVLLGIVIFKQEVRCAIGVDAACEKMAAEYTDEEAKRDRQ